MTTSLETMGYGLVAGAGTHVCDQIVKKTGASLSSLDDNPNRKVHQTIAGIFGDCTDLLQSLTMKTIESLEDKIIVLIAGEDMYSSLALKLNAVKNFLNQTIMAPIVEEATYRGPQVLAGMLLYNYANANPLVSQAIVGLATNIMFGLAHTAANNPVRRFKQEMFLESTAKGSALAATAGFVSNSNKDNPLAGTIHALGAAIIGHSLSNLPGAISVLRASWSQANQID